MATHYGITKRQLMDPEAGDLAVRMALGEAQVRSNQLATGAPPSPPPPFCARSCMATTHVPHPPAPSNAPPLFPRGSQVISQTKEALAEAGVAVERLEAAAGAAGHASTSKVGQLRPPPLAQCQTA